MIHLKYYLLMASACACLCLPGYGQARDTAFAVHKLFVQRRGGADAMLAVAGETMAATTLAGAVSGMVAGAAPAAIGLSRSARYSSAREGAIISSYANGWPLPADVRRQLRRKHFHRTRKDVLLGH